MKARDSKGPSSDGADDGLPLIPAVSGALAARDYKMPRAEDDVGIIPVAFQDRFRGDDGRGYDRPPPAVEGVTGALETVKPWNVATPYAVRRLTPVECERLQGFPDGWTDIPWRGKPGAPDGPRYKALGNSFAVNVVRWIGERIQIVEGIDGQG